MEKEKQPESVAGRNGIQSPGKGLAPDTRWRTVTGEERKPEKVDVFLRVGGK